jgi:hypothetical protein
MQNDLAPAYVVPIGYLFAWFVSVIVVVVSLGMAGGVAVRALSGLTSPESRFRLFIPVSAIAIALALLIWNGFVKEPNGLFVEVVMLVGQNTWPGIEHLETGARRVGGLGTAASILMLCAMIGLTYSGAYLGPGTKIELDVVRERITILRHLLYLAAVGLAAGVVATAMMLSLHIDFPGLDPNQIDTAKLLVRNASLTYGAGFSLLLILGYAPTAIVLDRWVRRLGRAELPDATLTKRREWRQENELDTPLTSQIWQVLAVFAPFLASVVGDPVTRVVTGLMQG